MTDIQTLVQTTLDTALAGAVYAFWQRKAEIESDPNPDEYVVYTLGPDKGKAFADNSPLLMEADVTVRYYYRYELIDTATGRTIVKNRTNQILTALKGAGFSCPGGFFDAGDVDEVGCFTSVCECSYGRASYPYHLNGELCRVYAAADITIMATAAMQHKIYHSTYCNHLNIWVRRSASVEAVQAITYGAALPVDLEDNMKEVLGHVG